MLLGAVRSIAAAACVCRLAYAGLCDSVHLPALARQEEGIWFGLLANAAKLSPTIYNPSRVYKADLSPIPTCCILVTLPTTNASLFLAALRVRKYAASSRTYTHCQRLSLILQKTDPHVMAGNSSHPYATHTDKWGMEMTARKVTRPD